MKAQPMGSVKYSRYNYIFPGLKENEFILFNTLSHAIYEIDSEIKAKIEANDIAVGKETYENFREDGVLVGLAENELGEFSESYKRQQAEFPKTQFMVALMYGCNLGCDYCFEKDLKPEPMRESNYNKILEFMKKRILLHNKRKVELHLFGGEPFIAPKAQFGLIKGVSDFCRGNGFEFSYLVYTNGTCLADSTMLEVLETQKAGQLRYLQLTLDGFREDHNKRRHYRNGAGTYDRIMGALESLKKMGISTVVRINVDSKNHPGIPRLLDDLKARGLGGIPIGFGIIREMTEGCSSNENAIKEKDLEWILSETYGAAVEKGFHVELSPKFGYLYCSAFADSTYIIGPDACLYKCAGLQGRAEHCFGKISEDGEISEFNKGLYDSWMGRDPAKFEECRECRMLPACGGGCAAKVFTEHGTYAKPDCFDRTEGIVGQKIRLYLRQKTLLEGK